LYLIAVHVFPISKPLQNYLKIFLNFTDLGTSFGLGRLTGRSTMLITGQNGRLFGWPNLWQWSVHVCAHSTSTDRLTVLPCSRPMSWLTVIILVLVKHGWPSTNGRTF